MIGDPTVREVRGVATGDTSVFIRELEDRAELHIRKLSGHVTLHPRTLAQLGRDCLRAARRLEQRKEKTPD